MRDVLHFIGRGAPLCNPRAFLAPVTQDKSQVTCHLCWNRLLRKAASPKRKRRKIQQKSKPVFPVKIIMAKGKALMPKRLRKVLPAITKTHDLVQSRLSPKHAKGSLVGVARPLGSDWTPTPTPDTPRSNPHIGRAE